MSALRKYHVPLPGALLALLAFFLPWISVGCEGLFTVDASGFDLAAGSFFDKVAELAGDVGQSIDPGIFRILWAIPVVAVVSLVLVFLTTRNQTTEKQTAVGHIIFGLIGLVALLFIWFQNRNAGSDVAGADMVIGELVQLKYGIWATIAGLLIIIVGGVLSYLEARQGGRLGSYGTYVPETFQVVGQPTPYQGSTTPTATTEGGQFRGPDLEPPRVTVAAVESTPARRSTEVLNQEPVALAWLVVKEGPRTGQTFRLFESTSIGRDPGNDIIIDDTSLSGQHARIKLEEGEHFMMYDLASTNGVFAYDTEKGDWERVYRYELADGRQIKIGRTVLHFMHLNQEQAG